MTVSIAVKRCARTLAAAMCILAAAATSAAETGATWQAIGSGQHGEPDVDLDQSCPLPLRPPELDHFVIAQVDDWRSIRSAIASYDTALLAYTECLAAAESLMLELRPEDKVNSGEARLRRHLAAVATGESAAETASRAFLDYLDRAVTPPAIKKNPPESARASCAPIASSGLYYRILSSTIILRISADAKLVGVSFPAIMKSSLKETIRCIVATAQFEPARQEGKAIAGFLSVSVRGDFGGIGIGPPMEPPSLASSPEETASAFERCRSPGLSDGGSVRLHLAVSRNGRVTGTSTVASSGSEAVDGIANCVARKLIYVPARFEGEKVDSSSVNLKLWIAPAN